MPAIDPARLRRQSADLAEWFGRPERFLYELEALLEFYADRTQRRRSEDTQKTAPLLKHHNLPAPALARVLAELEPRAARQPEAALALADVLWARPVFETRLLACRLLGNLPTDTASLVLERIQSWGRVNEEETLIPALASDALVRLRLEAPDVFFDQVQAWLESEALREQRLGVRALRALLEETGFSNLPRLYQLLTPRVRQHNTRLRPSLVRLLAALARASAPETAYFLRELLADGNPQVAWLVRNSLEFFPPEHAQTLKAAARGPRPAD